MPQTLPAGSRTATHQLQASNVSGNATDPDGSWEPPPEAALAWMDGQNQDVGYVRRPDANQRQLGVHADGKKPTEGRGRERWRVEAEEHGRKRRRRSDS